jgi:hypothetical protein
LEKGAVKERRKLVRECWAEADAAEERWFQRIREVAAAKKAPVAAPYRRAWNRMGRLAALPAF